MDSNWFKELFIDEAKAAQSRHSGGSAGEIKLQEKTVTVNGEVVPDVGYDGLSKVTVSGIPDELTRIIGEHGKSSLASNFVRYAMSYYEGTEIPLFDISNVTDMEGMFHTCKNLTAVPSFDTSKAVNMKLAFTNCTSLTTFPLLDTSKVTDMSYMFQTCTSLTTIPLLDTSKVTNMDSMFRFCHSLITVPRLDVRNVNVSGAMLGSCCNLTECWLRNIKTNLQVGSGSSWGHLLTLESLIHLIKELRDTGSMKQLTIGSVNLNKLANVYVKTVPITDEMRAEDDLIDEKLPFEVCESTDEGAMLITNYALLKNWSVL